MVGSIGELVTCCALQVTNDLLYSGTVSGLWIGHKLHDLLNSMSDVRACHDYSMHKQADN